MKKLFFIIMFMAATASFAQLNEEAEHLKEKAPDTYTAIKYFSQYKWEDDYTMVLHEINEQSKAFVEFILFKDKNKGFPGLSDILGKAIIKWTKNPETLTGDNILSNPYTDWSMVLFEMKEQVKARKSY